MSNANEYLDYAQPTAGAVDIQRLHELAELQARADADVKDLEAKLAAARERFKSLSEHQLPELMDEIGMAEFKTSTGLSIKITETIRASIPKAREALAFQWLRDNNNASMIKRIVSVSFGKGEDEKASELLNQLAQQELEADDKSSVHPSTLAAFVREKLASGEEIPQELFGVHRQRISKIDMA